MAKPFTEIPKISAFEMIKRNMPGKKYHNQPLINMFKLIHEEFGDIVRMPGLIPGQPESVLIFKSADFETVWLFNSLFINDNW